MDDVFQRLKQRLQDNPGKALNLPGTELREAAVLAPMFLRGGEPWLLFTLRPMTLRQHAGQIAFPGGGRDPEDRTPLHTALRETNEELGIPEERVEVLGMLDEIPTITSFRVVPFVGLIPDGLQLKPNADEVEELIELPVSSLMAPGLPRVEQWNVMGREREVYFYEVAGRSIWGATARILKDLLGVMREVLG